MEPLFDHEKLDVYGVELEFVAWTADFFDDKGQIREGFPDHRRPRARNLAHERN